MNVRFFIDPETDEPHIYNHGISEEEVEDVLRFPGEDRPGRGDSRAVVGQTSSGRHLRVVYLVDPYPDSVFVITAYDLKGRPLAAYRKRRRKR